MSEIWIPFVLLLPVMAVAAYRLGLRDGLWQAGRTLPGVGGKKRPAARGKGEKDLARRVEEF